MNLMSPRLPMPFQSVKDRTTVETAGTQTKAMTMMAGMATISTTISLSIVVRVRGWDDRSPRRRVVAAGPGRVITSATEDRALLLLDVVEQGVDVVGVLDELLQRRDHHGGGEVGTGVAVEELRDRLGAAHELRGLLLQCRVPAGVGVVVGADVVRVGLEVGVLRLRRAEVLEQVLGTVGVAGPRGHHEAVDGRLDRVGAHRGVDLREREEVQVVTVGALAELLADEQAERVHPGLLVQHRLRRLLPGPAERVRLVEREDAAPG